MKLSVEYIKSWFYSDFAEKTTLLKNLNSPIYVSPFWEEKRNS